MHDWFSFHLANAFLPSSTKRQRRTPAGTFYTLTPCSDYAMLYRTAVVLTFEL